MSGLLLRGGLLVFAFALAVVAFKMLAVKGWKTKSLATLAVLAAIVFNIGAFIPGKSGVEPTSSGISQQETGSGNYLTESNRAYNDGLSALKNKNYLQAMEFFSRVVPEDPNYNDAVSKYEQAQKGYVASLLITGQDQIQKGDYGSAIKILELALTYDPNSVESKRLKQQAQAQSELLMEKLAARKAAEDAARAKSRMGKWEFGSGPLGVMVGQARLSSTVATAYGFSYDSRGSNNSRYIWLRVFVINKGGSAVAVRPDDFNLVTADGYRVTRNEATFSQDYFKPGNISPEQTRDGWLIFFVPKAGRYTLEYYGSAGMVKKDVVL